MREVLTIVLLTLNFSAFGQQSTELVGYVKGIDADTLLLAQSHKDLRYNGVKIPVRGGERFQHTLSYKYVEEYSFVYMSDLTNGAWRPITFFPNGSTVEFELYPSMEFDRNNIVGDDLGLRKREYQRAFGEKLMKDGDEFYGKIFQLEKGTREYEAAKMELDSFTRSVLSFHHMYFLDDNSILGLSEYVELLQNAEQMKIPVESFAQYQEYYLKQHFDHPLAERAIRLYTALSHIKVGQPYLDIELVELSTSSVDLSAIIDATKYTMLDLWSPWCGPCIRKSKLLKENYSELSGILQVVAVVGGTDSVEKASMAISKQGYPWVTYIEVSDWNRIWEKYGIRSSGGAQFLIDKSGKIAAINPTLEEVQAIVNE